MRGARAKELRAEALELSGPRSWLERVEHRPRPLLDMAGRLLGQVPCWTDRWEGFRRTYQDLKRQARADRRRPTHKIEKNRRTQ